MPIKWLTVTEVQAQLNISRAAVHWQIQHNWKRDNLAEKDAQVNQWFISPRAIDNYISLPVRVDGRRYAKKS